MHYYKSFLIWTFLMLIIIFISNGLCGADFIFFTDKIECNMLAMYIVSAFCFPLGIVTLVVINSISAGLSSLGIEFADNMFFLYVVMFSVIATGYYQWFILVPKLWLKIKRK